MIIELISLILLWFGIYYIVSLSLNMEFGYAGIPNFGKALSVLVGAIAVGGILDRLLMLYFGIGGGLIEGSTYATSMINDVIASNPIVGIGILILAIILASILGFVVGAIFILPSAKLKEDYLGVTLLAISEAVVLVCTYNLNIIGGYYGISTPDVLAFVSGEYRGWVFTGMVLFIAFLVYLFFERLLNTPFGRVLRAMRENEDTVKAFGRDIMKLRIKTMAIGSAIGAIAGALYSLYTVNIVANAFTRVEWTFFPFLMVLLGGKGNNKGVALGVLCYVIVKVLLDVYKYDLKYTLNIPFEPVWLSYMLFGVLMLLILYYKPSGLIPEKPIITAPMKKKIIEISNK
ncbi:ABC-type branched-chain amino acid transport system, permease component [Methanocaldococcus bathoardescens]|uniref:ABC-type branched-chain amino acid transport system, permease component n=1 Tax=Methanocaldococcus bathoardescens TaxID=1301915 RepID=A0A076LAA9_9EURY|nr:branched-chain amino acid ABC transporter permease [Methanocaldococcus bathoardescens]AIJ05305.1 ABC-type branched-chain amino acid transport system, permease component [Methanocaldococcus bathoardescens]